MYINATCHVLTASTCIALNNSLISQKLLSTMSFLLKIAYKNLYSFKNICSLDIIRPSSSCEIQMRLIGMVYINKTHTKHLEKDNIGKGEVQLWAWMLLNFCFLTVQEKQVMKWTHFWTWDLSRKTNQLFFEKILHSNELKVEKVSSNVPDLL